VVAIAVAVAIAAAVAIAVATNSLTAADDARIKIAKPF
jgi:hypothetical protein